MGRLKFIIPGNARRYMLDDLDQRKERLVKAGYPVSKWISFCEEMQAIGFDTYVYESQSTRSKYIYVTDGDRAYKVRFSDHAPNYKKEFYGDCDFFVGRTHLQVSTTHQAIQATRKFFNIA